MIGQLQLSMMKTSTRTAFERWSNVMSRLDDATGVTNPTSYMTDGYANS